jgi:predicted RNase H-like nuclease
MAYVTRTTLTIDLADGHNTKHRAAVEEAIDKAVAELSKLEGVTVSVDGPVTVNASRTGKRGPKKAAE